MEDKVIGRNEKNLYEKLNRIQWIVHSENEISQIPSPSCLFPVNSVKSCIKDLRLTSFEIEALIFIDLFISLKIEMKSI